MFGDLNCVLKNAFGRLSLLSSWFVVFVSLAKATLEKQYLLW